MVESNDSTLENGTPTECGTVTCHADAVVTVHWPGKSLPMCAPCADRASAQGAMGFALTRDPLQ